MWEETHTTSGRTCKFPMTRTQELLVLRIGDSAPWFLITGKLQRLPNRKLCPASMPHYVRGLRPPWPLRIGCISGAFIACVESCPLSDHPRYILMQSVKKASDIDSWGCCRVVKRAQVCHFFPQSSPCIASLLCSVSTWPFHIWHENGL